MSIPQLTHPFSPLQLTQLEKDKKIAAQKNFRMKVEQVSQNIAGYLEEKARFMEKCQDAQSRLEGICKDHRAMDARLKKLQPSLRLDTIDERCKCIVCGKTTSGEYT